MIDRAGSVGVSIVVPVRNEERHLAACIASLVAQDRDPGRYEVLVVDGESTDRTLQIAGEAASRHPQVRVMANPGRTVACGRNLGLAHARGEVVAFVEGHARVGPAFVGLIERAFQRDGVSCLGRTVEQHLPGGNAVQKATGLLRKSRLGRNPHSLRFGGADGRLVDPLTVATVYHRSVFERVGTFDEALTTNEDVEFNWRVRALGIRALHVRGLIYYLQPRGTIGGFAQQMFRYGYGKALFVRRHPRAFRIAYAAPSLALLLSIAGIALGEARVLLVPILAYLLLSGMAALRRPRGGGHPYRGLRLLLSLLMLVCFGAGFVLGAVGRSSMGMPKREQPPTSASYPGGSSAAEPKTPVSALSDGQTV